MALQSILLGENMDNVVNEVSGVAVVMTSLNLHNTLRLCGHFAPLDADPKMTAHLRFSKEDLQAAFSVIDDLIAADRKRVALNVASKLRESDMTQAQADFFLREAVNNEHCLFSLNTYCKDGKYALTIAALGYEPLRVIIFATSADTHEFV